MNILTLTGLTLSVGILVDGAIIQVENALYRLRSREGEREDQKRTVLAALQEVSPGVFLALSIIVVAFLPLLALTGSEGKLFRPLVFAKTSVMLVAAVSAVFITPALRTVCLLLARTETVPAERVMRSIVLVYARALRPLLSSPWLVVLGALVVVKFTIPAFLELGFEFLPPFEEGSRLFMPTTAPGLSIAAAKDLIQRQTQLPSASVYLDASPFNAAAYLIQAQAAVDRSGVAVSRMSNASRNV